jgi:hypothetical protein
MAAIDPLTAGAVLLATAATDAVYVMFTSAVVARKRVPAATWSSVWYLLSSYAVISYTENWVYVAFAAVGSWLGAYATITFLHRPPAVHRWGRAGVDCWSSSRASPQQSSVIARRCVGGNRWHSRPLETEGAGKTGCTLHPRSRAQLRTEDAHTSLQVQRKHSGLHGNRRFELSPGLPSPLQCGGITKGKTKWTWV